LGPADRAGARLRLGAPGSENFSSRTGWLGQFAVILAPTSCRDSATSAKWLYPDIQDLRQPPIARCEFLLPEGVRKRHFVTHIYMASRRFEQNARHEGMCSHLDVGREFAGPAIRYWD
jgi:hypothetical protein